MTESSVSQVQKSTQLDSLAKDAVVALFIKVAGLILIYVLQIFLARWMGKTEYGIYEYVIAWTLLLAIPAGLGLPRTTLRLISEYRVKQDWSSLRGILRGSWLLTLLSACLVCLITAIVIWSLNYFRNFIYAIPLLVGLGLIALQALVQLQVETARAMNDIALAYTPSLIIWPILVLSGGFIFREKNHFLTSLPMIGIATSMLFIVCLFQSFLLRQTVNNQIKPATPNYAYRQWITISLVLLLQRAFLIILDETDIIMVGSLIGPSAAGTYNVAAKTALWVTFILETMNIVVAPAFATLYTQGDIQGLQKVVSQVAVWIFLPSLSIGCILLIFTEPVLSIFGPDFIVASISLKILILGRLIDSFCGSVGALMVMTGHQNKALPVFGCSAIMNLVLNAIAIPKFGIMGAAITTTFTMIVWNVWLSTLVVKYIGIRPWVFYSLFKLGEKSTTES